MDIPVRYLLTTALLAHLGSVLGAAVPTGRGTAPPEGGWSAGQPGAGTFTPYVVVKTSVGRPAPPQTLGRHTIPRWQLGYRLSTAGWLESEVDTVANAVRSAACDWGTTSMVNLDLAGTVWRLERIALESLGPTIPNRSTDPPYWDVTDDVSVWLSLQRG